MGYVFTYNDAVADDAWFSVPKNREKNELETELMMNMLRPGFGERILDIGCGIGMSLLPFIEKGLVGTGLDPSPYMIFFAKNHLGNRADLHRGFAEELPFSDNSFDHACLIKTLEFVDDPQKAIEEACRVAKDRLLIGLLNPHSTRGTRLRVQRIFTKTIYNHAHFFSIWAVKQIIRTVLGDVPISWRTISQFPSAGTGGLSHRIGHSDLVQRSPFGAFTGMVVTLVPRFRTRPLELSPYPVKPAGSAVGGLARNERR